MKTAQRMRPWVLPALGFLTAPFATDALAQGPQMIRDIVYGHMDGMAMVYDVMSPAANPNGAGVVFVVSGGFLSSRPGSGSWE